MAEEPNPVEVAWRRRAREFAEASILPLQRSIDRDDRFPADLTARLAEAGFLGVGLPSDWGGRGGNTRCVAAVLEELARASAAVATLVSVHISVCAQPIERWGTESQKEAFLRPLAQGRWIGAFALTEAGAGSDAARIACRYRRDGGELVLLGSKMFITNGASADVILTFAAAVDGPHSGRISALLLRKGTPGFTAPQRLDKLGLRGSETNELLYDDVRLPVNALLGEEGHGLSLALGALTAGRVGIAACALGVAQAAYDEVERAVRADPQDRNRSTLARAYTRLVAARSLVERAADRRDRGQPFVREGSAAKLACSETALWIAERAVDLGGVDAALAGSRPAQLLRDARVFPIVEGTTEIQELILGRALSGE
ncbi:MAG: acyl-CoA dehydrogenase family protein [Thermoplasmata archaeon]|nr:acyl-CoA dehydrogenase family protein [Thermoplasmata archaeon]MCI4359339.1 acyl-CoA dehydrogenase family protein [Thermoplasmata archaeon]